MGRVIGKAVIDLFAEFQAQSPVGTEETTGVKGYSGGSFKEAWDIDVIGDNEWRITNNMGYATILFEGRRMVAGKYQGSEQWPEGGLVMLEQFNRYIERKLR